MDRPFDARRAMLIDSNQPPHEWRPVSLVVALRAALLQEPTTLPLPVNNHRQRTIRAIMDELTNRGLDGDSLVRFGMGPEIMGAILEFLIPDWFATTGFDVSVSASRSTLAIAGTAQATSAPRDISTDWRRLMETRLPLASEAGSEDPQQVFRQVQACMLALAQTALPWVMAAPLDDVIALRPPPEESLRVRSSGGDRASCHDTQQGGPTSPDGRYGRYVERQNARTCSGAAA